MLTFGLPCELNAGSNSQSMDVYVAHVDRMHGTSSCSGMLLATLPETILGIDCRNLARASYYTLLLHAGTFDLLVYTDAASDVPQEWEDSDPRFIQNAADVKLRSFTTKVSTKQFLLIVMLVAAMKCQVHPC